MTSPFPTFCMQTLVPDSDTRVSSRERTRVNKDDIVWQTIKKQGHSRHVSDWSEVFESRHLPIFPHSTPKWSPAYAKTVAKKI